MPNNKAAALENNFSTWSKKRFPTPPKDFNIFQYYCIEQFARSYDLGDSQLRDGIVDGGGDGGVDAFYVLANGEMVDAETELDPNQAPEFKLVIMQLKSNEGFSPTAVDKMYWFTDDLLDLSRKKADYHSAYHSNLVSMMRVFKDKFGVVVGQTPPITIEFIYVVKKDVVPNGDCKKSAQKVENTCVKYLQQAKTTFRFINASALWAQVETRPPRKKTLVWDSQPMSIKEGQVGLVKLSDYYAFIREPDGSIAERFFDSNVRGYWPTSSINTRIGETLNNPDTNPEFWLLNNGITILTEKVDAGSNFLEIEVNDPQIVNGLQTSRQIYHYFKAQAAIRDKRRVLVRIINTGDTGIRDSVIRCTNSQNPMPDESLRATDPIHRMLETSFHTVGLYYDRRKGYYRDQGKPVDRIVSVIDVLQAIVAIVLQRPDDARGRPKDYIKKTLLYNSVFGEDTLSLEVYLKTTSICRRVTHFLADKALEPIHRRNIKFYLAMYATCMATSNGYANPSAIQKIDITAMTDAFLESCYFRVWKRYEHLTTKLANGGEKDYDSIAKGHGQYLLRALQKELRTKFNPKPKK